ncbi:hypothetical protein BZU93_30205 [Salmonella enterica subsp. enterica]|nr:hypothetical protein [Salmonella enterica subsp. enterica serovar Enteritidis]
MTVTELLQAQLLDPFRTALLIAMIYTARNTAAQAGVLLPVALGMIFVAVLIPMTLGQAQADKALAIGVGLLSNAIIVAIVWAVWTLIARMRRN